MKANDADQLTALRAEIDRMDATLLDLLADRLALCFRVGKLKNDLGVPMMQPARIAAVMERMSKLAEARQLAPQFVCDVWQLVIAEACRLETDPPILQSRDSCS